MTTKAGDGQEADNTYDLPDGSELTKELKAWYTKQAIEVIGSLPKKSAKLPKKFAALTDYDDPMASAMTPILQVYWSKAGSDIKDAMGLDPETWQVTDPNVSKAIDKQSLLFCASTNASTSQRLDEALQNLRAQLKQGVIDEGEALPKLTKRVNEIFTGLKKSHAEMIAQTETSRAIHEASEMSVMQGDAEGNEVARSKHWLLTSDACPVCYRLRDESEPDGITVGKTFGKVGNSPEYSNVRMPPAHPRCRCTVTYGMLQRYLDQLPKSSKVKPFVQVAGKPSDIPSDSKPGAQS